MFFQTLFPKMFHFRCTVREFEMRCEHMQKQIHIANQRRNMLIEELDQNQQSIEASYNNRLKWVFTIHSCFPPIIDLLSFFLSAEKWKNDVGGGLRQWRKSFEWRGMRCRKKLKT